MSTYDPMCLERDALSGAWILFCGFDPYRFNLSAHCVATFCCAKLSTVQRLCAAAPPDARWDCGFISGDAIRACFPNAVLLNGEAMLAAIDAEG